MIQVIIKYIQVAFIYMPPVFHFFKFKYVFNIVHKQEKKNWTFDLTLINIVYFISLSHDRYLVYLAFRNNKNGEYFYIYIILPQIIFRKILNDILPRRLMYKLIIGISDIISFIKKLYQQTYLTGFNHMGKITLS